MTVSDRQVPVAVDALIDLARGALSVHVAFPESAARNRPTGWVLGASPFRGGERVNTGGA